MIVHEAVGMADPVVACSNIMMKKIQETFPIFIIQEDGLFLVSPAGYMIDSAREFNS